MEGELHRSQSMNGWNYAEANPLKYIDPTGRSVSPGFIEDSIRVSAWTTNATDDWFSWALGFTGESHPIVAQVYNNISSRLQQGKFMDGSVQSLYRETRLLAREALAGQMCSTTDEWRESAHVALVILAGIGRVTKDARGGGPGFIANPEAEDEVGKRGPDTGWHFFYHSFLSFEILYGAEYNLPEYYELKYGIDQSAGLVSSKVGDVEQRYREQVGDTFVSLDPGVNDAYYSAVTAGNFYEVISTYDNAERARLEQCSVDPLTVGSVTIGVPVSGNNRYICMLEAVTDSLTDFENLMDNQDPYYTSGVRDPGVFTRDLRANHLGAVFGVNAFYFPHALPPQP